jgi:hypothetical protein
MLRASDFEKIVSHAGLIDRSDRVRLDINGPDRAKFLHNLTTNDVKRLPAGRVCCDEIIASKKSNGNHPGKSGGFVRASDPHRVLQEQAPFAP